MASLPAAFIFLSTIFLPGSAALASATSRAALHMLAGETSTGLVSANVAALIKEEPEPCCCRSSKPQPLSP
jgi:hypothetical protein